jgi:hypothetical protein
MAGICECNEGKWDGEQQCSVPLFGEVSPSPPDISNDLVFTVYFISNPKLQPISFTGTMTDSLIPLPTVAIYWRDQLFNLIAPVTMTAEEFDEI